MQIEIKGTSAGIGKIVLEDYGKDCYSVTVTNGRIGGEFAKEIKLVISKEDVKRLAKAS